MIRHVYQSTALVDFLYFRYVVFFCKIGHSKASQIDVENFALHDPCTIYGKDEMAGSVLPVQPRTIFGGKLFDVLGDWRFLSQNREKDRSKIEDL